MSFGRKRVHVPLCGQKRPELAAVRRDDRHIGPLSVRTRASDNRGSRNVCYRDTFAYFAGRTSNTFWNGRNCFDRIGLLILLRLRLGHVRERLSARRALLPLIELRNELRVQIVGARSAVGHSLRASYAKDAGPLWKLSWNSSKALWIVRMFAPYVRAVSASYLERSHRNAAFRVNPAIRKHADTLV